MKEIRTGAVKTQPGPYIAPRKIISYSKKKRVSLFIE
jgi:hypothetical protein